MNIPITLEYNGEVGILCDGELLAEIVEGNADKAQYIVTAANMLPELVDNLTAAMKLIDERLDFLDQNVVSFQESVRELLEKVKS